MRNWIVFFLFSCNALFAAQYEMDFINHLNSKYLGKRINCIDPNYNNYVHKERVMQLYIENEVYFVVLKNKIVCKINFFTYGIPQERFDSPDRSNTEGKQAVMDTQKFLNSMLQNVGNEGSAIANTGGSFDVDQAQFQTNQKNHWTSKSEIHYTELNSMTNKKSKVRITSKGIFIDNYKIGITFEREISK